MSVETLPAPAVEQTDRSDIDHYVCECDPDTALCGFDVSEQDWLPPEPTPNDCVVCLDLLGQCPRCGDLS